MYQKVKLVGDEAIKRSLQAGLDKITNSCDYLSAAALLSYRVELSIGIVLHKIVHDPWC